MKKKLKFISAILSASLLITPISGIINKNDNVAKAYNNNYYNNYNKLTEQELEQKIAKELEILFTQVITEENNKLKFNEKIAKEKLGFNQELINTFKEVVAEKNGIMSRSFKDCMYNQVKSLFGLPPIGTMITALETRAYVEAAKIFISMYGKQLAKASPWILAGTLGGLAAYCYGK